MSKFVLIASLFLSASAFAQSVKLPKDTIALNSVSAEVLQQQPLCPKSVKCVANGTVLLLGTLGGCLDKLLPLTYEQVGDEVVVHAQVAVNKDSAVVMCTVAPVLTDSVTLFNVYPPFKLRFLGTGQTVEVK